MFLETPLSIMVFGLICSSIGALIIKIWDKSYPDKNKVLENETQLRRDIFDNEIASRKNSSEHEAELRKDASELRKELQDEVKQLRLEIKTVSDDLNQWKMKYFDLLSKYTDLLSKNTDLENKYNQLKKEFELTQFSQGIKTDGKPETGTSK